LQPPKLPEQSAVRRAYRRRAVAAPSRVRERNLLSLDEQRVTVKTVTSREFHHRPSLVAALHAGQSVIVTDKGQPKFKVTKAAGRPVKRCADLEREAKAICASASPKVNFAELLQSIR
jgi:antitoxin (DNA-binding transcriptional repressor) of toxin-antitoxin stability system